MTDVKHFRSLFKLLLDKWGNKDSARAAASGGGEEFGEVGRLLSDIREEMDAHKVDVDVPFLKKEEREEKILGAGMSVRDMAPNFCR